jgi:hypothetical protein
MGQAGWEAGARHSIKAAAQRGFIKQNPHGQGRRAQ